MKSYTFKLFLVLSIIIVTACDTQPIKPEEASIEDTRPVTDKQASLLQEAENLIELAEDSNTETEQLAYRLRAASLYLDAGKTERAKQQLAVMKTQAGYAHVPAKKITPLALASISLLSADIAISEKNITAANDILTNSKPITREQQIYFYELKADLDLLSGKYMQAVEQRVQLGSYISDEKNRDRNNRKIWAALSNLSNVQLNSQQSTNPTVQGWLELAKVMRTGQQQINQLENELLDWGTRNPAHPVSHAFLNELIDNYQYNVSERVHIAVLLPLQGKHENVTETIKNGILSAYYIDSNSPTKPIISFYDSSNKDLNFQQLVQQAMDKGATNIIGPLDKVVINQLAQQSELAIPVLTLNYSETAFSNTKNLFQFGLSPEDEARQVAELAIRQNKLRAAVFYPDSEWGQRLNTAFSQHYELLGGKVLTTQDYATNTNDYRRPIRALFNLDQSDIRRRKVENTISAITQSESYRRQDIDMIFLAATHQSARGIMPAFKFHHAAELPVYSTSHVFTGNINRELDHDLDGLIYCDLPWILQNNSPLAKTFKQNWPQQEDYTRLFALGIDAYRLVYNLDYLKNKEYAFYAGQTGNIQLDENNRITRQLLWAKFKNGKPIYFEPVTVEHANTIKDRP